MENIKVSIITPVYNAGKYLEKNLLFLTKQTLKEIEFILINDASTDNSLDIMTAFHIAFPNKFIVINSEKNQGPGGARNLGIQYARGEYIGFVDCDDYTNPQMFELMYNKAKEKNSDLVMCAYRHKGLENDVFIDTDKFKNGLTTEARAYLLSYVGFLWHSIFKKDVLKQMSSLFRQKCIYEDVDFLSEVYMRIKSIDFVAKSLYMYVDNSVSISHKKRNLEENMETIIECIKAIYLRCKDFENFNQVKTGIDYAILKISQTILEAFIAYNQVTPENIEKLNHILREYTTDYMQNPFIDTNITQINLLHLYNTNDKIFFKNVVEYCISKN